ncbi:hypothetical protein QAD02_006190, partial [Eretmocerus hayati]
LGYRKWPECIMKIICLLILLSGHINCFLAQNVGSGSKVCKTDICLEKAAAILENMDPKIDPCEDFYQYACGNYLKNGDLPGKHQQYDVAQQIQDEINEQLRFAVEEPITDDDIETFVKVKKYYKVCMSKDGTEDTGKKDLRRIMNKLGGWPLLMGNSWNESQFNWERMMIDFHRVGFGHDHFIGLRVEHDKKSSAYKFVYIDPPYVDIPHDYLNDLSPETKMLALDSMVNLAKKFGAKMDRAMEELGDVLHFMVNLTRISLPQHESLDESNRFKVMSVGDLRLRYPAANWIEYMNGVLAPHVRVEKHDKAVVFNPNYFKNLSQILENTSKRTLANYVFYREIQALADYTNILNDKKDQTISKAEVEAAKNRRSTQCLGEVTENFRLGIGAMYVRTYFDDRKKNVAEKLLFQITDQLLHLIKKNTWIDDTTKISIWDKLSKLKSLIAYPDILLDNSELDQFYKNWEINTQSFLKTQLNMNKIREANFYKYMKNLSKSYWHDEVVDVTTAIPYFDQISQILILPAALLKKANPEKNHPKFMSHADLGFNIAHEITHSFDSEAQLSDTTGYPNGLWSQKSEKEFQNKTSCLINQYDGYKIEGLSPRITGRVVSEDVADNIGLKAAYAAYEQWLKFNNEDYELPGLESIPPKRMFWIAFANSFCAKYTPVGLENALSTGLRTINPYRVIGSISNRPEFALDFGCPAGSKMNPVNKCEFL